MKRILLSLTAVLFLFSLAYAGDEPKVFTEKDLKKYKSSKDDEATQKYNESVRKEQETAKKEQMKAEETPPVLKSNTIKKYSEGDKWKWGDNSAELSPHFHLSPSEYFFIVFDFKTGGVSSAFICSFLAVSCSFLTDSLYFCVASSSLEDLYFFKSFSVKTFGSSPA